MRPACITIIGVLFVLGGVVTVLDVVADLFQGHININLAVCLLFVGIGLLRLNGSSRRWAIFWIVLGYVLSGLLVAGYFVFPEYSVTLRGDEVHGPLRPIVGLGIPVVLTMFLFWMHSILRRPRIVALFSSNDTPNRSMRTDRATLDR